MVTTRFLEKPEWLQVVTVYAKWGGETSDTCRYLSDDAM